jgi:hypothetical protein
MVAGTFSAVGRLSVAGLMALLAAPAALAQCGGQSGSCQEAHEGPGCDEADCCAMICEISPSCCAIAWDAPCASAALTLCPSGGCPGSGDCFEPDGSPGCKDTSCCTVVCAVDPFCCDVVWDGLCVKEAAQQCLSPFDLNGDGGVNVGDLVALILAFGPCAEPPQACPADFNQDGAVNVPDLIELLFNWSA